MMRRILLGALMLAVVISNAVSLGAHEQFRIIGKIVGFEKLQLVVDSNYSERFVLDLQEGTLVQRDKKRGAVLGWQQLRESSRLVSCPDRLRA